MEERPLTKEEIEERDKRTKAYQKGRERMQNRKNEYADMLKSPKWQKKRLEIMQRDGFVCQHCGDDETTLHIHHLRYDFSIKPWEYNNDDLVTLCEHCHNRVTENKNKLPKRETIEKLKKFVDSERTYRIEKLRDGVRFLVEETETLEIIAGFFLDFDFINNFLSYKQVSKSNNDECPF